MLLGDDFKKDESKFCETYSDFKSYQQFIDYYTDNIHIDLTGKIVLSVAGHCLNKVNTPMDILAIFIDEGERFGYKSELIYAGHIAFIKCVFKDKTIWRYKDDECMPVNYQDFVYGGCSGDLVYEWCEEGTGYKVDFFKQIKYFVRSVFDLNYELDSNKLVILQGL